MTDLNKEEQRGKRRTAYSVGTTLLALITLALWGVTDAYTILELILPYAVALIIGLFGLDAHYNPKRV